MLHLLSLFITAISPIQDDASDLEEFPLIVEEEIIDSQEIVFDDSLEDFEE